MTQQDIADATRRSQSAIHYILKGDRMPSVDMAERLEKATGICREAWIWPERHYNPYIQFQGLRNCLTCSNRTKRTQRVIETSITHFKNTKNKRAAFEYLNLIAQIYTGMSDVVFLWRKITKEGLPILAHSGHPTMPALKTMSPDSFPRIWEIAQKQKTLAIEHIPYGLDESWEKEIALFRKYQIRSTLIVAKGSLLWASYSIGIPMTWKPELSDQMGNALQIISDIWEKSKETDI